MRLIDDVFRNKIVFPIKHEIRDLYPSPVIFVFDLLLLLCAYWVLKTKYDDNIEKK